VIVVAGLAVGLLLSFATHRACRVAVWRFYPKREVYETAAAVLTISAMTAVLIPALRAARMQPAIVLRDE
jgi:ABC-type antimicrobial peptide transport system permease subunit